VKKLPWRNWKQFSHAMERGDDIVTELLIKAQTDPHLDKQFKELAQDDKIKVKDMNKKQRKIRFKTWDDFMDALDRGDPDAVKLDAEADRDTDLDEQLSDLPDREEVEEEEKKQELKKKAPERSELWDKISDKE